MKNWLIAILIPALMSCSMGSNDDFYRSSYGDKQEIDSFKLPKHAINDVVKGLAYQMLENTQQWDEAQLENEQVSKQLEHRIKVNQEQFSTQFQTIEQLLHQQPEDKLYSRAQKLVELGADIEEIMRECDIPRPEAEMLLAVHRQQSNKS